MWNAPIITIDDIWYGLKSHGEAYDEMGYVIPQPIDPQNIEYLKQVIVGNKYQFVLKIKHEWRHPINPLLIFVLGRGTSGKVWLLSPSYWRPSPYFTALYTPFFIIPKNIHENDEAQTIEFEGNPGTEEIIAIILPGFSVAHLGIRWLNGLLSQLERNFPEILELSTTQLLEFFLALPKERIIVHTQFELCMTNA